MTRKVVHFYLVVRRMLTLTARWFPLRDSLTKQGTNASLLHQQNLEYEGRSVVIGIFDTGTMITTDGLTRLGRQHVFSSRILKFLEFYSRQSDEQLTNSSYRVRTRRFRSHSKDNHMTCGMQASVLLERLKKLSRNEHL